MKSFREFSKLKTLYVSRPLYNAWEVMDWATTAGIRDFVKDPHVTVAFSKTPVDWDLVPEHGEQLECIGGARSVGPLGKEGAIVLHFENTLLSDQHQAIHRAGAQWAFPHYRPHVTLTYTPPKLDLSKLAPYEGRLVFSPEVRAPVQTPPIGKR